VSLVARNSTPYCLAAPGNNVVPLYLAILSIPTPALARATAIPMLKTGLNAHTLAPQLRPRFLRSAVLSNPPLATTTLHPRSTTARQRNPSAACFSSLMSTAGHSPF